MFSVHTPPEEFENAAITGDVIVFEKLRIQNVSVQTKTQSRRFQIPPLEKSFPKAPFS